MNQRINRWKPKKFWGWVEQLAPVVLASLATKFVWLGLNDAEQRAKVAYDLAGPLVSVMAIAVGFVAASLTILTTAVTRAIARLRDNKYGYGKLLQYHAWATYIGVFACIVNLSELAKKHYVANGGPSWMDQVWFFFNAWAGLAFLRVLVILVELLYPPSEDFTDL